MNFEVEQRCIPDVCFSGKRTTKTDWTKRNRWMDGWMLWMREESALCALGVCCERNWVKRKTMGFCPTWVCMLLFFSCSLFCTTQNKHTKAAIGRVLCVHPFATGMEEFNACQCIAPHVAEFRVWHGFASHMVWFHVCSVRFFFRFAHSCDRVHQYSWSCYCWTRHGATIPPSTGQSHTLGSARSKS